MKRKLIATLLVMGLMLTFVPMTIFSTSAEDTWSTEGDQLYVTTKADLLAFATAIAGGNTFSGKTINIMADIDVTGETWPLQGKTSTVFSGMIDGNGHTLSGIKSTSTGNYQALFANYLVPVSTFVTGVKNLTVKNSSVSGGTPTGGMFAQINGKSGDVAGKVLFDNLDLDIDVSATGTYAGGIAGISRSDEMTISNCIVRSSISSSSTIVGGIFGWQMDKKLTVANSVISATVAGNRVVGGFFGQIRERAGGNGTDTVVDGCVFDGTVTASYANTAWDGTRAGGCVGLIGDGSASAPRPGVLTVQNSAFYGALESTGGIVTKVGGLVGENMSGVASKITVTDVLVSCYMSGPSGASAGNNGAVLGWLNTAGIFTQTNVAGSVKAIDTNHKALVTGTVGTAPVSGTPTDRTWSINNAYIADMFGTTMKSDLKFYNKAGDKFFDLSETFVATTATKPLPMGVARFYAEDTEGVSASAATYAYGYQNTADATAIRLIGLLKADESLPAYENVGLDIVAIRADGTTVKSINNADKAATNTVYTSVEANGETVKASDMDANYKYLFTVAIEGIQADGGLVTFVVRSFHEVDGVRTYDDTRVINYDPAAEAA